MRPTRRQNSGKSDSDFKTNLFDDPERDLPAVTDREYERPAWFEDDEAWLEETFDFDVDEVCSTCAGAGSVTYEDELDADECPACCGTGALIRI